MKKILIFGGTFDPVHLGHTRICKAAIKRVKPCLTIIVPNKTPPLKVLSYKKTNSLFTFQMCKLAFKKFDKTIISDFEFNDKEAKISYTYKTIQHIKDKYPNAKLFLLIGYDRYLDFKLWKNYKYILKNVTLVVSYRNSKKTPHDDNVIFLNTALIPISSNQLRLFPNVKYLSKPIIEYIVKNNLYIDEQVKNMMSDYRYAHTLRVVQTAREIAMSVAPRLVNKAIIASYYHDIAKEFSNKQILTLVTKWNEKKYPTIQTLHGLAGSIYVKKTFHIIDKDILNAIKNHVIPSNHPSKLDMIVYCADKLESGRKESDISKRNLKLKFVKEKLVNGYKDVYNEIKGKYC